MNMKLDSKKKKQMLLICIMILVVVCALLLIRSRKDSGASSQVITTTTLEKIINISELSTYTAVYEGVAEVCNEKKSEKVDYYVAYKAMIYAGINLEEVSVSISGNEIRIDIPEVYITDINVDIKSLDFMFYNAKANAPAVTEEAYKACEADVALECEKLSAIQELAEENAKSVLQALVKPFVDQFGENYSLIIE